METKFDLKLTLLVMFKILNSCLIHVIRGTVLSIAYFRCIEEYIYYYYILYIYYYYSYYTVKYTALQNESCFACNTVFVITERRYL